jgi:ATP-dependent Clp protease ATP-binding subunit ClpA
MRLVGRRAECGMLDRLVEAVCAGQSRALVLCGEPGVGKTALLQYLIGRAADCRVVQTAGVESEMELAFAGLHQCALRCWMVWRVCRSGRAMRCGSRWG